MGKLSQAVAVAVLMAASMPSHAQTEDHIVPKQVSDDFYVLYPGLGQGSNVGVLKYDGGLLVVDAMMERASQELKSAIAEISPKTVTHVINTHGHMDHTGGNKMFEEVGATVVQYAPSPDNDNRGLELLSTLTDAGLQLEVHPVKSHTASDLLIYLPEQNVLFTGDAFMTNWHPTFYGGGAAGQIDMIDTALGITDKDTIIVPGHGMITDREALIRYREAFGDWMKRLGQLVSAGVEGDSLLDDDGLREIALRFRQETPADPLPEGSYRRFVERSVSTEFMPVDDSVLPGIAGYSGSYTYEDGVKLEIVLKGDTLLVYEGGEYSGRIVPLSPTHFHFPGRLEGQGYLTFDLNGAGKVQGATYVGAEKSLPARREGD
ncbi:MBL fold metallo-hydrolase [Kordiimonas aestuarii]|uniref:MBL fold metallo-hydrolase n=1 Tax=Kordiimonas aestuarii TaxID=1005925 RepID=UPI0021D2786E|nr:MBL fold metallo-hydrolase [Kordiimonas aestuarii]